MPKAGAILENGKDSVVVYSLKLLPHDGSSAPHSAKAAIFASSAPALLWLKKQNLHSETKNA